MDVQELKDHVSQFRGVIESKQKETLDIFYNEIHFSELLSNDEYFRVTPSYTTETKPALSFRGSIQKHGPEKLTVELEYVPLSKEHIIFCVNWNFSVYNEQTDTYLHLASSETDITANNLISRISFPLLATKTFMNKNNALFKWNITFWPLTICQDKFKSDIGNYELYDEDNFKKALDNIFKTFSSSDDNSETKKKEELLLIKDALNECEYEQKMNVERLQIIEQNVFEINSRLSGILSKKVDLPQTSCVKEVTQLTHSSPNTSQTELKSKHTKNNGKATRFTPSPSTAKSNKQKQLKLKRKRTLKDDRYFKAKRAERFPIEERQKNKKQNMMWEPPLFTNFNVSEPSKIQSKREMELKHTDTTDITSFELLEKKRKQDILSQTNKTLTSLKFYQNPRLPMQQTDVSFQSNFGLQSELESAASIFSTINSSYNISEEMKEKTDQILSLLQQCFSILETERKMKEEKEPIGIEKKEANQVPKYMGLFSLKPINSD
ncbi:hypothetical protein BgiBS90_023275 [Biomphalaria glabrata]|nr:hypothetical protein BgiBS90_023275 [Biomphalaria glabrata]